MVSSFNLFHRWIGLGRNPRNTINNVGDSSSEAGAAATVTDNDSPITSAVECYACTQVGVPVFHSTSCDSCHQPQWEASAGSYLVPIQNRPGKVARAVSWANSGPFGSVLDPRSKRVQAWNRALLLARGVALAIDPLFFYALSIGREGSPCLYMDGGLAAMVTVARTCVDAVHLIHVWLQFRLAYVSRESLVVGCGKLVWDARAIASHYLRSFKGFWFDAFVILPVPQVRRNLQLFSLLALCFRFFTLSPIKIPCTRSLCKFKSNGA